ncbi:glycosyltransferase family 39 protein [Candidatus Poribacteria bacterium]|nr:glycosyltransferase family 39 protein [Candidatus Poribacteria bacterium]
MEIKTIFTNEKKFILALFIFAVLLKLLYVFFIEGINTHPGVDGVFYDKVALNVARGYGFVVNPDDPATEKPPIYMYMLAFLYFIFGHNYGSIRIVQAILGGVICVFTYYIGKKIKNETIGQIASIFVALDPMLIQISAWYLSQIFYITFEVAALYYLTKMQEKFIITYAIIIGLCLGLACLTISYSSPFFYPFLFLWSYLVYKKNWANILKAFLTISMVMTLTISIWTLRNYIILKEFIPISTAGGLRFWGGNNPRAEGVWVPWAGSARFYFSANEPGWGKAKDWVDWANQAGSPWLNLQFARSKGLSANERDIRYWKMGFKWIFNNPGDYLILACKKIATFWQYWNPLTTLPRPNKTWRYVGKIYYYPLLILTFIGAFFSFKERSKFISLYIFILHSLTGAIVFFGDAGQRAPITPILWILAAIGISEIISGASLYLIKYYKKLPCNIFTMKYNIVLVKELK